MPLGIFLPLQFLKNLKRKDVSSSLNVWQNFPVKPSGPGLLFAGRFFITISISLVLISLMIFSISSWFSPGRTGCIFLNICPFLPGCQFYRHIFACSNLLWFYCISAVSVITSPFSFLIFIEFSAFFSWWVWLMVYQFCLSSQRMRLQFYWSLLFFSSFFLHLFPLCSLWFLSFY